MWRAAREHWQEYLRTKAQSNEFTSVLLDLVGDSAQYFIGLILIGLANTILLPLYMRYLAPAQFGLYALIEVTSLGLMLLAGLGFNTSYLKFYAEVEGHRASRLFGSMTLISGVAAAALGAGFSVLARSAEGSRLLGGDTKGIALLLLPLVLFESLYACFETHLRACRRPTSISSSAVIRLIAIAGFSIWLMAVRKQGLIGLFEGRVLGDACSLGVAGYYCRGEFALRISRPMAKAMLRYGAPLVVIGLMMLGLDAAARYLLDSYGSLNEVGLYTAGIKISNLMRILFVAPLGAAWGGLMFQIAKKPNAKFIYSKLFGYVFLIAAAVAAVIALMTPALFAIFAAPAYKPGMALVPWLLLVQVLSILQAPLATGLYVGHATRWLIPIYVTGLASDIAAGRLLVPEYGMYGAVWAWLIGWGAISLLLTLAGQKSYPLRFEWRSIAISFSICAFVPTIRYLGVMNLELTSIVKQAVCGATAVAIVASYIAHDVKKSRAEFGRGFPRKEALGEFAAQSD
jgi:O-antigen/teichoic acid export membrane protein